MKLPPGVSEETFRSAVSAFRKAVGDQWVFVTQEDLDLYRDAYSPLKGDPDEIVASAAVAPQSVEEVQQVVRIANQFKIPLYPISTGRNLGYGGSAPAMSGSVVLDLKRMNRVLEVNEQYAYALVEPGVSYFDLYRHIQEKGYKLWIDPPDPGWGSLIGNALDRGGGWSTVKYRDHFSAHCGMEVVLANGEVMRTGMGAMPNAKTWQHFKAGCGPWVDGIFSQSNFGVVTKMGFWLMPQPDAYLSATVSVFKYEDIVPLVDTAALLENLDIHPGLPILFGPLTYNRVLLGGAEGRTPLPAEVDQILARSNGPPYAELEKYCQAHKIGFWGFRLQFYGPPEVIRAQWAYCKQKFSAIDGVQLEEGELLKFPLTEEQLQDKHLVSFGIPNLEAFAATARSEQMPIALGGHIDFSPVLPRSGKEILKAHRVFSNAARELGLGLPGRVPAVVMGNFERAYMFVFSFPVLNPELNAKSRDAFRKLVRLAADNGWGEYRTHPAFYKDVMDTYSFNNHALMRFHETIKDAIDPNGILSPGRYGIWPKNLRGTGKS